ncbi:MAG: hypothetical protein GX235_10725 [Clostridiales bacterium]|nr:hypothetical protein [Clostridiales bacterium]
MKNLVGRMKTMLLKNKPVWICTLLGAAVFVMIYGIHILNPCYTDWLLTSEDGDLTQHYLGWKFFRHAPWRFPLGLIDTLAYPNMTSVIFTDSIPFFALFFKVFRFLLPAEFQYFGWFGLLCFMLQGGVGAILVKKYIKNDFSVVIGGMFFVLSPVFIDRMYWMTSLAAQFLCLIALLFIVYYDDIFRKTSNAVIGWSILGALCAGIHIYFLPMCGVILLGFLLIDLVKGEKKWKVLLPLASYVGTAAAVVFLLGGFGSGMKAGNDGVGYYSFNLNGFYNPQGWSGYLKDMPCTDSQYEGFGYLGLGVLVLFAVAFILWLGNIAVKKTRLSLWIKEHIREVAYAFIVVAIVILAASNIVMYDDKVLYEIPIPGSVYKLWSIFRATGRLIWPVVYLIVFGAVCMDGRLINKRTKGILLTLCLLLQIADIKGALVQKNNVYNKIDTYQTLLPSENWLMLAQETDVEHICFVSDVANSRKLLFSFGDYASDYGLTLSNFYFARSIGDKEIIARDEALRALPSDTVFIFFRNEAQKCLNYKMNYYDIDGLIVGCSEPLGDMVPLDKKALTTYRYELSDGQYMNNGEVVDGTWNIHPYGNTYGPYLSAEAGKYKVTVTGSNLNEVEVKCYYNGGDVNLQPQNIVIGENHVTCEVELTEYAGDLEFALWNTGGSDIVVSGIVIEKE